MTAAAGTVRAAASFVVSVPRRVLLSVLSVYQHAISPLTPPTCRFYPSCSSYAVIAVRRFGAVRGTWLAVKRVARCHPWTPGGVDDVPEVSSSRACRVAVRSSGV